MMSSLGFLAGWAEGWIASGRLDVSVAWECSPEDREKRSAWMTVQGPAAWGQITIWESGEVSVEAMSAETGDHLISNHSVSENSEDLLQKIRRLVGVCEMQPSGQGSESVDRSRP